MHCDAHPVRDRQLVCLLICVCAAMLPDVQQRFKRTPGVLLWLACINTVS
jgi:hypothetical protein